ncbi:uncharacterized protein DNG_00018 [Cephalotrichum gorgonifer]|uniref:DUF6923 domain-containing protein n=1 Tax=Cephalotrichum gorgonifer TaxID=2041049 RepID=A0AAE8SQD5_9PEZI|nr:uncharacterized protein DNG_00018 [Cephalotrichum gorgonifer]
MSPLSHFLLLIAAPLALGRALLDLHLPLFPEHPYPEKPYPEPPYPEPTPPPPELTCDKYGYLIQYAQLIRIDIDTGGYETVGTAIGDNSAVNALGYNPLDNLLYGYQGSTNQVIRIAADGSSSIAATLQNAAGYILGDFDAQGYYWVATQNAATWIKIDLRPGSPAYGQAVETGTTPSPGRSVADWVYVPIAGPYLWSVGANPIGGASLIRWGFATHQWEIIANYPGIDNGFGALYGINNGTIFASNNANGRIWAFSLLDNTQPYIASQGPPSGSNDGARCVANVEI